MTTLSEKYEAVGRRQIEYEIAMAKLNEAKKDLIEALNKEEQERQREKPKE